MQVPWGEESKQIPIVRVWEREDMTDFVLTQVPWAGGSAELQKQTEGCYPCLQLEDEEWEDWE